ncbi:hypothetical protein [uncultured Sphingomonas sp.]
MPSAISRLIWDNGVPLSDAWRHFADPAIIADLEQSPGFIGTIAAEMTDLKAEPNLSSIVEVATKASAALSRKHEIESDLKDELLDSLFNGELTATGYREAPSTSPAPVVIAAADFDDAEPNWTASHLSVNGKRYGRVRITDERKPIVSTKPVRPMGRPGSGNAIMAAIDNLIADGTDFQNIPRSIACELIREKLGQPRRTGNGLTDINLAKYLVLKTGRKSISENT